MILHFYIARRFLMMFLSILAIFAILQLLLDFIDYLRRYDGVTLPDVLQLTFLKLPQGMYELVPLVVALAAISMFLALSRSSELVVARAAGRNGVTLVIAPCLMAFTIGLMALDNRQSDCGLYVQTVGCSDRSVEKRRRVQFIAGVRGALAASRIRRGSNGYSGPQRRRGRHAPV